MTQGKRRCCWLVACTLLLLGCGPPEPRRSSTTSLRDMVGHEVALTGKLRGPGEYGTILITPIGQVYILSAPNGVGAPNWTADRNSEQTLYTVTGILRHRPPDVATDLATTEEYYYFDDATTKVEIAEVTQ